MLTKPKTEVEAKYRLDKKTRPLFRVRRIDSNTGRQEVCSDKRCKGKINTCRVCTMQVGIDSLSPMLDTTLYTLVHRKSIAVEVARVHREAAKCEQRQRGSL